MTELVAAIEEHRATLAGVGQTSATLGRRVVVTGLAGSGKSTFSRALAARTGLPIVYLDLAYWKPGWTHPTEAEWCAKQREVLAGDEWIADGNYHDTLDLRLELADSVVVLDLPWWQCSARALRRGFEMPGELPEGCPYSRFHRWRDEWQLAGRIWLHRRDEPEHERRTIAEHASRVAVHVLRSQREVDAFLVTVGAGPVAGRHQGPEVS